MTEALLADGPLDIDGLAAAEEARSVAAERIAQRYRRKTARAASSGLAQGEPPASGGNVFDQFDADPDAGEAGLRERARLNALDGFYRGTLSGSARLSTMAHFVRTPDPADTPPDTRRVRDGLRNEYHEIVADLARYDLMKPWGTTAEAAIALSGQIGGSIISPESFAGVAARGATALIRTGKAAAQQAGIMAGVDPLVQALNINAGVEDHFSVKRWMASTALGGLIGGGLHGFGEVVGSTLLKRKIAKLAEEDEAFVSDWVSRELREQAEPNAAPVRQDNEPTKPVPDTAMEPRAKQAGETSEPAQQSEAPAQEGSGAPISLSNVSEEAPVRVQWMANRTGSNGHQEFGNQTLFLPLNEQTFADYDVAPGWSFERYLSDAEKPENLGYRPTLIEAHPDGRLWQVGNAETFERHLNSYPQRNWRRQVGDFFSEEAQTFGRLDDEVVYGRSLIDRSREPKEPEPPLWSPDHSSPRSAAALRTDLSAENQSLLARREGVRQAPDTSVSAMAAMPRLPDGARITGESVHGPTVEGFQDRWTDAVAWLRAAQTGDARGVLAHPEIPERIDVIWGTNDYGLKHIVRLHPEVVDDLPQRLARMRLDHVTTPGQHEERIVLRSPDGAESAIIRPNFDGVPKHWLLTAYTPESDHRTGGASGSGGPRRGGDTAGSPPESGPAQSLSPPENSNILPEALKRQDDAFGAVQNLAQRRGGGLLRMERQRPGVGVPSGTAPPGAGTAIIDIPDAPPSTRPPEAIRSLQQQALDFADAIGFPLRQGRIKGGKVVLGTFNPSTGVVRTREIADFEVVAHEAGHAIELKVGAALTSLTQTFGHELAPLVSAPGMYDPSQHVKEGFAEWVRRYIGNPAWAEKVAPGFTVAFRNFMGRQAPVVLDAIENAGRAYRAYLDAPSVDAVHAVVRGRDEDPPGWRGVLASIRNDGFPTVVTKAIEKSYDAVLDQFAPAARAVREAARYIRDLEGKPIDLKAADNPEIHLRLLGRTQQAAVLDMTQGVRPYHDITPQGPSLRDALATALGDFGAWGKWDVELKALFSDYLVARRAEYLWNRFKAGEIENPPVAFSQADARVAVADLERANPSFRQAADMVHAYTRELLRKQYDGGLIGAELYHKLLQQEFYVPFLRDLRDRPLAGGDSATGGVRDRVADTVQRLRGSTRDVKDPIESIMLQTFLVNRALRHNDMIHAFVRYFRRAGLNGGRYVEPIPAQEARAYTFDLRAAIERAAKERGMDADDTRVLLGGITDFFGEDPLMGTFFKMEPAGKRGEPIVFYKEGGELRAARFMAGEEGHALYEIVTTMPSGLADTAAQALAVSSSVLRSGVTTNPVFMITNFIRDQVAAGLLRPDYIPFVHGAKGMYAELAQTEAAALYGYAGGVSAGSHIAPLEQAITLDPQALKANSYVSSRVQSLHGLLELASVTEAGTRNSIFETVYRQKRAQGLSEYESMFEAAWQAQDIIDFSRRGSKTMWIVAATPFFNATMQGLDKARRVLFEPIFHRIRDRGFVLETDREQFRNALLSWGKMLGVGSVLGAAWAAVHQDDPIYRNANAERLGSHFITSIGGKQIEIPKPFELGLGFTAGEYAYKRLMQEDPRAAHQFAEAAWEVLLPPKPIFDNPLIKTTAELAAGVSFYPSLFNPRQIVPDTLKRLPANQQYTDRTTAAAKALGAAIGVSPIKVDYAIGSYFGLWGRDLMAMSSGVDQDAPERSWTDMALVRRFVKDPTRSSDVTNRFWDYMGATTGKYNQAVAAHSELINRKSQESDALAADFLSKLPPGQRGYVILRNAAGDNGRAAFTADQRRLHPLQRAYDAVTLLNGIRREMDKDSFAPFETSERLSFNRQLRGQVRDVVRELAQTEMLNALIVTKEPGYANQPMQDTGVILEKIRKLAPEVADEIAVRYATAKVYPLKAVTAAYPQLQSALLRDGSEADLSQLQADASANGYEFGAERVTRPQRRRVPISGTAGRLP